MSADLALINTHVHTMNPRKPAAEAVAIKKNKIIKVGTTQEINRLIGKSTKIMSLSGKTVVPGLIDTHVHVADFGRCLLWLDLTSAKSIKELQNMLKIKSEETSPGKWIIGRGWNHDRFKEKRLLKISDLDQAAPNNPVILYHEAAMICAVNSKAIAIAKVTKQTPIPAGEAIDKDPQTGEFTGIFRDTATNLVWQAVPEPTDAELLDAASLACQKIAEAGLTSIHWLVLSENEFSIIGKLNVQKKLAVRVNVVVPEALLEKAGSFKSVDTAMLRFGGVMIVVDGYLDSKTAALTQPYADDIANRGKLLCSEQTLAASVSKVLAAGFQPVVQAMGDRAVNFALTVIEKSPSTEVRFRIEQAAVLNQELIKRLKKQKIVVSVQPTVINTEFSVWSAINHLGVERARWLHPLKTLLDSGVKVAGGSDCPMEPLNPMLGVQGVVLRESFPEQRLSVEEALRMYTFDAAYSSCEEDVKGSIEEGKLADLTVLDGDPAASAADKIKSINVELTIVDGKIIFSKH